VLGELVRHFVIYMNPYGRFSFDEHRGDYAVTVELAPGYRVEEIPSGRRVIVGPECDRCLDLQEALRRGIALLI
jgi:hypothetical protein